MWPWIRKVVGKEDYYYIDISIMEIFTPRLPALTFKKLSEKTGFEYVKDHNGRMKIRCDREELVWFIITGEAAAAAAAATDPVGAKDKN